MYNIEKRKQFSTVGDLREMLNGISDDTKIVITGDDYCWFHIEEDESVICLDVEELEEAYDYRRESWFISSTPCDHGDCPFDARGGEDCRYYCGLGVDE